MLLFRKAETRDLRAVVDLLTADAVAGPRGVAFETFERMFAEMLEDRNQLLAVAEQNGAVIGCLQITIIPGLSRGATRRGQIEGMRIHSAQRGRGHGSAFVVWAVAECRARGCTLVQLTTDRQRTGPLQFYERLGFRNSHYGLKLEI
jgi:ribosomal protein S18 acetylase RimI-like enzyme